MTTEHKPDELERSADGSPGQSPEEATDEEERAWQEALRRARTEFADEDTDTVMDRPEPALLERTGDHDSGPLARQAARPAPAQAAPPAAQQVAPPRKRRTSRPNEGVLPPQTVTVRRQRQTGRMDLAVPADQAAPPADLASDAPADAPRSSSPASSPASGPPAPAPGPANASPAAPAAAPPSAASAVARVLGDASARARERSREREALERVLAMAKPRTRQTRLTPAVVPPLPADPDGPADLDNPEDPDDSENR